MDSEAVSWLYIYSIVDNFEKLVIYFYVLLHQYAPWFRQGAFALIFSVGMFLVGVQMLKIPFDRMKGVGYTFGMIALAGFLNSPTTNTKAFEPVTDAELSVGGYWSYHILRQVIGVYRSTLDSSWQASMREQAGASPGMVSEAIDVAWNDNANRYADTYLKGLGAEVYKDYMIKCARPLEKALKNDDERQSLRLIGIGSNMLGMSERDAMDLAQRRLDAGREDRNWYQKALNALQSTNISPDALNSGPQVELARLHQARIRGEELLKTRLADENNPLDGKTGYLIPSGLNYSNSLRGTASSSGQAEFEKVSQLGPKFAEMLPEGSVSVDPNSNEDYNFYPKNCYDLYLLADKTMSNFRGAVKDLPEFRNMQYSQAFQSQSVSMKVTDALTNQINEQLVALEVDERVSASAMTSIADQTADIFRTISEWINRHVIHYKIPALITTMALVSVILVITFPIFASLSVIFGHRVLVTYAKLVALPFIVVFLNQFLIQITTNIIAYNNMNTQLVNTFYPGTSDAASALSGQNIKAIIFTLLTVAELAVAKFLLFDDYRAVTSGNPGAATTNAVRSGAGAAATAVGAVAMPLRMGMSAQRVAASRAAAKQNTARTASKNASNNAGFSGGTAWNVQPGGGSSAGLSATMSYASKPNSGSRKNDGASSSSRDLSGSSMKKTT